MIVAKISPMSGQVNQLELPITQDAYEAWRSGSLIQTAMPHLTPAQREFLISGYTPEEQEILFTPDEE
jgi:hypothetical protein